MPLAQGTRLGVYELGSLIGAGAMGEVYRARDTKLRREVAVKVLPDSFARDPERLARFQREARFLASLNHSGIATLHGLENEAGTHFLVLELVPGETLADRLDRGPLAFADALPLFLQIAEALEAAHAGGVVHRDLKPANVKVTPEGKIKILDFGLAKGLFEESAASDLSQSPTLARDATNAGVLLGTACYMSPEQARGKAVDKRTDIWAFGCLLYEALTGKHAFDGENVADVLAAVVHEEPRWEALPPETPRRARDVLARCLRKDLHERLHDIADARIELGESEAPEAQPKHGVTGRRLARDALAVLVGLGIAAGIIAGISSLTARPAAEPRELPVSRFAIPLPADAPFVLNNLPGRALALSPDGTQIVYATAHFLPDSRFRVRRLDDTEIRSIPGTERGYSPFFSPDGEWLGYFDAAEAALKKIPVRGGRAVTLQRGFPNAGWMFGTWCEDDQIVFDTWNGGLRVIGADGGNPRMLTEPTEEWHLDPQPLPGPCRVLFYTYRAEGHAIEAITADGGERTRILDNASHGRFLASGHLLFVRDGALQLAPFDADRLKVTGPAIPLQLEALVDQVSYGAPHPQLAVSTNGTLVYAPSDDKAARESHLVAVTHDGLVEELGMLPFPSPALALSPDGERLALAGRRAGQATIEALDLRRGATTALVDLGAVDMPAQPVWTPDGTALLYARHGPVEGEIVRHVVDRSVSDQILLRMPGTWFCPWSISPDGRFLLFSRYLPETAGDLMLLDLEAAPGVESVKSFVATPGNDLAAAISPNGKWVAYFSSESGPQELLIDKFPERGQKTLVSTGQYAVPVWSLDGRELYFTAASTPWSGGLDMMAVRIEVTPTMRVSAPRRLFSGAFAGGDDMGRALGIAPDGHRFLLVRNPQGAYAWGSFRRSATQLLVVQNWFAELRASSEETAQQVVHDARGAADREKPRATLAPFVPPRERPMSTQLSFPPVRLGDESEAFRLEVRGFLESERKAGTWGNDNHSWGGWNPDLSRKLGARGWIGMTWPSSYGGGERTFLDRYIYTEELLAAGAPAGAHWVADRQSGPLFIRFGTDEQRRRTCRAITRGEAYYRSA